jgi:hypothetical protein
MNHRSSATTALRNTRFVVRRGKIGWPLSLRENFSGLGAKIEYVPVPVLKINRSQYLDIFGPESLEIRLRET